MTTKAVKVGFSSSWNLTENKFIFSLQDSKNQIFKSFLRHPLIFEFLQNYFFLADDSHSNIKKTQIFQIYNISSLKKEDSNENNILLSENNYSELSEMCIFTFSSKDLDLYKKDLFTIGNFIISELIKILKKEEKNNNDSEEFIDSFWIDHFDLIFDSDHFEKITFGMACYWTGEAELGGIDGVYSTEPGWHMSLNECVEIKFDPKITNLEKIVEKAKQVNFFPMTHNQSQLEKIQNVNDNNILEIKNRFPIIPIGFVSKKVFKYFLTNSDNCFKFLPLSMAQSCRLNSAIYQNFDKEKIFKFLSPNQRNLFDKIEKEKEKKSKKWEEIQKLSNFPYHYLSNQVDILSKYNIHLISVLQN